MASNGAPQASGDAYTKTSLENIKRQLASGSGRNLLQGPLLKRSETWGRGVIGGSCGEGRAPCCQTLEIIFLLQFGQLKETIEFFMANTHFASVSKCAYCGLTFFPKCITF
uniref:Uncharacterized protein n=1 Tax=Solanum lycopersicum TaxID=4081 RepID=A0A3Q7HBG9_SOLLC